MLKPYLCHRNVKNKKETILTCKSGATNLSSFCSSKSSFLPNASISYFGCGSHISADLCLKWPLWCFTAGLPKININININNNIVLNQRRNINIRYCLKPDIFQILDSSGITIPQLIYHSSTTLLREPVCADLLAQRLCPISWRKRLL